jgi:hypothetical protein
MTKVTTMSPKMGPAFVRPGGWRCFFHRMPLFCCRGEYKRRKAGVQKENPFFHPLSGCVEGLKSIGFHGRIGVVAPSVGVGGRAAATGLRVPARVAAGRHRVTDSPRPRQQARPRSSNRKPLTELSPGQCGEIAFSF